tara:strand:+ start:231 stop:494 length:264 start_codon:yes stop_codon:yes gene_type:complete
LTSGLLLEATRWIYVVDGGSLRSERRQMTRPGRAPTYALKQKLEGAILATVEHLRKVGMLGPDGTPTHAMEEDVLLLRAKPGCEWQS